LSARLLLDVARTLKGFEAFVWMKCESLISGFKLFLLERELTFANPLTDIILEVTDSPIKTENKI
jgi:hypothetical protein